jgi:hypothetical protein
MEETRRIGDVGRLLQHWVFWPTYAVVVATLLLLIRPWETWFEKMTKSNEPPAIQVRGPEELPRFAKLCEVGIVLAGTAEGNPGADWLACDGRSVPRVEYPKLAELIGDRFGSEGDDVMLPNLSALWMSTLRGLTQTPCLWLTGADAERGALGRERLCFWIKAR